MYRYYAKLQKSVEHLAVQGQKRSTTETLRLNHYIWLVLVATVVSLLFIGVNIAAGTYPLAIALALFLSSMIGSLWMIPRTLNVSLIYHINNLVFVSMLTFVSVKGGIDNGSILWIYTYPVLSVFLFGNTIGSIWSIVLLILNIYFLAFQQGSEGDYSLGFTLRFAIAYLTMLTVTTRLEYERQAYIQRTKRQRRFLERERKSLRGEIYRRVELEEQLVKLANTDGLTGLYNRRCFWDEALEELAVSQRYKIPMSLAVIDIDHFKKINDSYGHQAGDAVLRYFGEICTKELRSTDIIGRIGGEEFAVLLLHTDTQQASDIMERFRENISQKSVQFKDKEIPFTISIGISSISTQATDLELAYSCADIALYQAKQDGRNQLKLSDIPQS
ncbi:GGDEF domain-containing protein [Vibrio sp. JC009]|uniref:GGDEF domain-containing protein n=1 Tax=Vibrio sp. JC009 TaxID=2912314 RepID=UPI0023B00BF0|nr:GGDEF domain-containing protein [Vibrio sp. JC009]WED23420.1 GGDEF domain-containing protein [Vibrio sp. JC009]